MQIHIDSRRNARVRWSGGVNIPPDKSITHRAYILAAFFLEETLIRSPLFAGDTDNLLLCLERLGARVRVGSQGVSISGIYCRFRGRSRARRGPRASPILAPSQPLFLGNSGTAARLLTGALAGSQAFAVLTGDASLSARPMKRIIEPLRSCGARLHARAGEYLPILIEPPLKGLSPIECRLEVPSAQVKSGLMLAALSASGRSTIVDPHRTRDHTERLFAWLDLPLKSRFAPAGGLEFRIDPIDVPRPGRHEISVPGDFSSAAFPLVLSLLNPSVRIVTAATGLNETRTGLLEVMKRMGVSIRVRCKKYLCNEIIGDIEVSLPKGGQLKAVDIAENETPGLIDEIPALALLLCRANGTSRVSGASELRKKESDRIKTIVAGLRNFGVDIVEKQDGFEIHGDPGAGFAAQGVCESAGDHRIAMMLILAGLVSAGETVVNGVDCISTSFPGFSRLLRGLGYEFELRN